MEPGERRDQRRRIGAGAAVVLVLAVATLTVVVGLVRTSSASTQSELPAPQVTSTTADAAAYVHVSGAVAAPGLYRLAVDARVVDAVAAAGGFTPSADRAAVNLARPISDGEQLIVPEVGAAPAPAPGTVAGGGADAVIDLNTADAALLETLPRIGPALAQRIVSWREENGRFTNVEDLLSVSGIGEKLLDGIRERVRV
ncbi:ComEA family DNA-binding protein [Microbacterium radiodurans]|uniref:Competence protein ComEA n=1 Tax=Microbacterium radiodurans TaxID=661398 RepID=A0A5J5IRX0_9MICO|nr:helix-hairpin-helix domain-containing protein [Microbacterium radiodurans]KAA9086791.1 competence protein ComEA [Microbacterium radiodurans]